MGLYFANIRSLFINYSKVKVPTSFRSSVLLVDKVLWYTSQETGFIDENVHKGRHNEKYNRMFPKDANYTLALMFFPFCLWAFSITFHPKKATSPRSTRTRAHLEAWEKETGVEEGEGELTTVGEGRVVLKAKIMMPIRDKQLTANASSRTRREELDR